MRLSQYLEEDRTAGWFSPKGKVKAISILGKPVNLLTLKFAFSKSEDEFSSSSFRLAIKPGQPNRDVIKQLKTLIKDADKLLSYNLEISVDQHAFSAEKPDR